ncbi:hypothetical protein QT970_27830, partial [Microcoleus sp. herbarium8]|uniref:hypothetical protein n=1 Tax=Microcoleus sp. herbarium8 TaxID=3055436 RepID=UPI002FD26609
PPLDCKKIALLGLCPTYDCVLMDSSTMFFALTRDRKFIHLEVCRGCFTKLICYGRAIELFTLNPVRESQGRSKTRFLEEIIVIAVK